MKNKNYHNEFCLGLSKKIPVIAIQKVQNEMSISVNNQDLIFVLTFLKKHISLQFKLLSCISGVDLISSSYRFSIVYDLLSLTFNSRIRVKVFANETTTIESCIPVFINANWWEREVWDMFGIYFQNHPDLRRILTDYGFEGHPLRKDFPLTGFVEVAYDSTKKRISLEDVELSQEFRLFSYDTNW